MAATQITHDKIKEDVVIGVSLSDETTEITSGTSIVTLRAPFAFTLTGLRLNVNTASSGAYPTVDVNLNGSSILGVKLSIDNSEKTSVTASLAPTITTAAIPDDGELTFDIDTAGTGTKGMKIWLFGYK